MKLKILTLAIMLCIFATTASAATHYLIVDNNSPSSDILKMNALTSYIIGEGESSVTHLSSEVDETPKNVVTVFMYFGEAIITAPPQYESFAEGIADFLKSNYGIDAEIKLPEDVEVQKFTYEMSEENLPEEAKGILYRINRMSKLVEGPNDVFLIYGEGDTHAYENVISSYFRQANSHQNRKMAQEASAGDIVGKNLIIVGGPCASPQWSAYSEETCENWPYVEGEGIIKVVDNGEYKVLLVAGTTAEDTFQITERLKLGTLSYGESGTNWALIDTN